VRSIAYAIFHFCLLNPCCVLALLAFLLIVLSVPTNRPADTIDSQAPVEVVGWISGPLQVADDFDYFEVTPLSLMQGGNTIPDYRGRIAVYVRKSPVESLQYLRYADIIRFESFLEPPQYYETPGVLDYREYLWQLGIPHVVRLKSPLQIHYVGFHSRWSWLRPLFDYVAAFEQYCRDKLEPRQVQFLLSLFLGRSKSLQEIDTEALKRLGILHIFVVSGSHVSLVLLSLHFFFRWFGLAGKAATLAGVWSYILIVGGGAPVLRSGIMATLLYLLMSSGLGRQFLNGLGCSALLLMAWHPPCVNSSSFQLTYLSLVAIGLFVLPYQKPLTIIAGGAGQVFSDQVCVVRAPEYRIRRWTRFLLEERMNFFPRRVSVPASRVVGWLAKYFADLALCSLFVPVLLLPVCVYYSNLWVWTQTLSNLIMVPLFALAVPLCLVLFLTFWLECSSPLAAAIGWYGDVLLEWVDWFSKWVWIEYLRHPSVLETACYLILFPCAFLLLKGRWKSLAFLAPLGLYAILTLAGASHTPDRLVITLLDVGQSESIHLRYPGGEDALIDTGGSLFGSDKSLDFIGQRVVSRYLWEERCRSLNYLLLTHSHADHTGGYRFIRSAFPISLLYFAEWEETYRGQRTRQLKAGDVFEISGVEHLILHPGPDPRAIGNTNDRSLVMLLRYRDFTMLFPGDIEHDVEVRLAPGIDEVTILKLAHHGSRHSNSFQWLRAAYPQAAVISAGRKSPFGHPSPHTLERLSQLGVSAYCTSTLGTLRIETDGKEYWSISRYSSTARQFELLK